MLSSSLAYAQENFPQAETDTETGAGDYVETDEEVQTEAGAETDAEIEEIILDAEMLQALTQPLRKFREGRIVAPPRTRIASRIQGIVKEVLVTENAQVKRGDILLEMDCSIERAELEAARLDHRLEKLKQEELKIQKPDSPSLQTATLATELKLARLNSLRKKVKQCQVTAPHDGKLTKISVRPHEGVTAFTTVMEMSDGAPPELHFSVPQEWLGTVVLEKEFSVEAYGETYAMRIFRIALEPNKDDGSFLVVAKFVRPKPIALGSTVRIYKDSLSNNTPSTEQSHGQ